MSPRYVLLETHLDQISDVLTELHETRGDGDKLYWDGESIFMVSIQLLIDLYDRLLFGSFLERNRIKIYHVSFESCRFKTIVIANSN